jgi:hypothetical protein
LTGSIWLGKGQVASTCEYPDEISGSTKSREFLEQLKTGLLLKKDSAPWGYEVCNDVNTRLRVRDDKISKPFTFS